MLSFQVSIEEWDGDGALRIPDAALQELGLDVGDSLYIVEADPVTQTLVLSKTPKRRELLDDLVDQVAGAGYRLSELNFGIVSTIGEYRLPSNGSIT